MSGTYFDAVLDNNMNPIFNGTPEETRAWLRDRSDYANLRVCIGRTLDLVYPKNYLGFKTEPCNSFRDIARFFASGGMIVSFPEFMNFWESLTNEEKEYYRGAPLI